MTKPTKSELAKYEKLLRHQLGVLTGDVGSLRDEALRAADQDNSVDHLADQGTDNYDQSFMLGLIENEEETIARIHEALDRIAGNGDVPFGMCFLCSEEVEREKPKKGTKSKLDPWIPKARLEYVPWARDCVRHQEEAERSRESA
jgi:RNA polymerase-binding transcription factor DksA